MTGGRSVGAARVGQRFETRLERELALEDELRMRLPSALRRIESDDHPIDGDGLP